MLTLPDLLGWAGVILFMLAYGLVSFGMLNATKATYQIMNLVGAALVGTQMYLLWNPPIMVMEMFWGAIGITALVKILRGGSEPEKVQISSKAFWHMFYCMLVEICKDHEHLTVENRNNIFIVRYAGAETYHYVLTDHGIDYGEGMITFAELEGAYDLVKKEIETTLEYLREFPPVVPEQPTD
jgi:hypothetical protein